MREYIRHPTDIPLYYKTIEDETHKKDFLKNIGHGGLCFNSGQPIAPGTELKIRIPVREPAYEEKVVVVWNRKKENGNWEIGVKFLSPHSEYRARLIEEICYIEHYRKEVEREEGRRLNGTEAASEWIAKYANKFPK